MIGGEDICSYVEVMLFLWISLRFDQGFLLFSREHVLHRAASL